MQNQCDFMFFTFSFGRKTLGIRIAGSPYTAGQSFPNFNNSCLVFGPRTQSISRAENLMFNKR